MIVAKQMIKINQLLPVGWSLSIGKIWEKLRTLSAAITEVICQMCHAKWESAELTSPSTSFTFCAKKVKEALRTRLSGNKITWTETFVGSKKFGKWKTTSNWGTLSCYENLLIKTHLKKWLRKYLSQTLATDWNW